MCALAKPLVQSRAVGLFGKFSNTQQASTKTMRPIKLMRWDWQRRVMVLVRAMLTYPALIPSILHTLCNRNSLMGTILINEVAEAYRLGISLL